MSNLRGPESDLPRGKDLDELIGGLDTYFRGVFNGNRKPNELLHPEQPLLDRAVAKYQDGFFEGLNKVNLRPLLVEHGERWVVNQMRGYFEKARSTEIRELMANKAPVFIVDKVGKVEIKDMYARSKERQDFYEVQAGRVTPGTHEHQEAKKQLDYWTVLTRILDLASAPDR